MLISEAQKTKTLAKSLRVLEMFIDEPELGVTEIAERLGLHKSNISDILSTFASFGYLERNERTGRYRLGVQPLKFAYPIAQRMDLHRIVYPHMLILAEHLGEIVYLAIPHHDEALYLQSAMPVADSGSYQMRSILGEKAPLYCTGIGKAMLSRMPESRWEERLPESFHRFTEYTVVDRETLYAELRETRVRGYAVDNMEHEFGICCVAIPLMNSRGGVVAGLSVSGPMQRFTPERREEIARALQQQSPRITACL